MSLKPRLPLKKQRLQLSKEAKRICLAEITGVHGLRGLVKLRFYGEDPDLLSVPLTDETGKKHFKVHLGSHQKNDMWIAEVEGVSGRDQALALAGTRLYIERDALPQTDEGTFYIEDLKGLDVVLEDGRAFGSVKAVHNFGAGDILEVKPAEGSSIYIPMTKAAVPEIDLNARKVVIADPEELFV